jgi:peptidoglycan/LPS O-acetylase OafA/YrhL
MAIASVVLYHFSGFVQPGPGPEPGALQAIAEHGYRGVNLFYVISGFILGLPFADHRLRGRPPVLIGRYFLRRLTRLEPPYLLNLLICFALLVANGSTAAALLPHFTASALYVHNFWFGDQGLINPVAWSLEVEVQFYCLAPLLAMLFSIRSKSRRRALLAGLTLVIGIVQLLFWDAAPRIKLSLLYAIQFFLAGFLLSDVYLLDRADKARRWHWDLAAVGGWLLLFALPDRAIWVAFPFLAIAVYLAAFRGVWMNRIFRNNFLVTCGGMCYTIYLFHYVLLQQLNLGAGASRGHAAGLQAFFYFPALVLVSYAYFVCIERPCMAKDWPQRALAWVRGSPGQAKP